MLDVRDREEIAVDNCRTVLVTCTVHSKQRIFMYFYPSRLRGVSCLLLPAYSELEEMASPVQEEDKPWVEDGEE